MSINRYSNTTKVYINNKDVTDGVIITEIYMDITNPCWSAKIMFLDSVNLIDNLPIQKNDKIKIIVKTKNMLFDEVREFDFTLYKIADKYHQNQKVIGYTLYATSQPLLTNMTKSVSRHLRGEPISLIKTMFTEYFNGYEFEGTASSGNVNIIASAWRPFNTFGQLLKYAHKKAKADYLFFQKENKVFTVKTIDDMYNDITDYKFKYVPNALSGNSYPYIITKYEVEHWDSGLNLLSGFYGSNVYSYDFLNKTFTNKESTNDEDNEKLNDGEKFKSDYDGHITFQSTHSGITDSKSQLNDFNVWLPSRHSSLMGLEQEKLLIQTQGNIEYTNILGKSILVEVPKQDYLSKERLDEKRSGKHLVSAMSFIINKQMFVTNIELVKRQFEV